MNGIKTVAICVVALAFMVIPASCWAQEFTAASAKHSAEFGLGVSSPVGGGTFLNKTAWIIPAISYEYRVFTHLSVGLSVGYLYSKENGQTEDQHNGDMVTGYSTRSLSLIPVQVKMRYYPLGKRLSMFQPYVGLAAGGSYASFSITGAVIQTSAGSNIGAVVTPEIGLRYRPRHCERIYVDLQGFMQIAFNKFTPLMSNRQQGAGARIGAGYLF